MADVSLGDLGTASNPLPGLDASDYAGYGSGGNISNFGDLFGGSTGLGGLAALGVGAAGFGAILGMGESPLPSEFSQDLQQVPALQAQGTNLYNEGQTLTQQGTQAVAQGASGTLTPEQQAQLGQYQKGLTNQARQMYASMGRNPDQDTSFINQTADIDAQVNAMAQQQIQTTIQLGLGELSAGSNFSGQALGFSNAASQILLQAGEAQLKQDQSYSSSLTSAFSAIGSLFGSAVKLL